MAVISLHSVLVSLIANGLLENDYTRDVFEEDVDFEARCYFFY